MRETRRPGGRETGGQGGGLAALLVCFPFSSLDRGGPRREGENRNPSTSGSPGAYGVPFRGGPGPPSTRPPCLPVSLSPCPLVPPSPPPPPPFPPAGETDPRGHVAAGPGHPPPIRPGRAGPR